MQQLKDWRRGVDKRLFLITKNYSTSKNTATEKDIHVDGDLFWFFHQLPLYTFPANLKFSFFFYFSFIPFQYIAVWNTFCCSLGV